MTIIFEANYLIVIEATYRYLNAVWTTREVYRSESPRVLLLIQELLG